MVLLYQHKRTKLFTDKDGDGVIEIFENVDSNEVLSENHYYPFGMDMNGAWMSNQGRGTDYKYNGKELNQDFGLDWYDYGARCYDASIGRFTGVDPIAEQYAHVTTYNYAENEPVGHIDLWGLQKADPPGANSPNNTKVKPKKITGADIISFLIWTWEARAREGVQGDSPGEAGYRDPTKKEDDKKSNLDKTQPKQDSNQNDEDEDDLPIYVVPESITPEIYKNTVKALTVDGQPSILTYMGTGPGMRKKKRKQRYEAVKEKRKENTDRTKSVDEYPYASTLEGGAGATTRIVPVSEQNDQKVLLNRFYRTELKYRKGARFRVVPVPKKKP